MCLTQSRCVACRTFRTHLSSSAVCQAVPGCHWKVQEQRRIITMGSGHKLLQIHQHYGITKLPCLVEDGLHGQLLPTLLLISYYPLAHLLCPTAPQAVATRWASDPMSYGSYSSMAVGGQGADDYDALARDIDNRVFFAGEATIAKWPATMHGAFLSGMREAAKVHMAMDKLRK